MDPDHPDFDSEQEYGNEDGSEESEPEDLESYVSDDEEQGEDEIEEEVMNKKNQQKGAKIVGKRTPADQFLAKREATLISILSKSFKSRVIIFANEKAQCTRLMALLTIFGFKAAEIHSNKS